MLHPRPAGLLALALLAAIQPRADAQSDDEPAAIRWEPYSTQGLDGAQLDGELGRITVPESRRRPDGPQIEIAFVRFRSTNPEPGPPIVYLVGGPGPSGIEFCVRPATGRMLRLLDFGDVIGIDQRGTGLSQPNLAEGPKFDYELPLDRAITRADLVAAFSSAVKRCAAHWKEKGVDLTAYNTVESADDVEDVRRALGLEQVITWGESYGTHLSLSYLRRHARHVARSVLFRLEGPDHTFKLPSTTQRHLERFHELVAADPGVNGQVPDFLGSVRALLKQLGEKPVVAEAESSGGTKVTLGRYDLQDYLANALGLAFEFRDLPAAIHRMSRGDWGGLARHALELRRNEVGSAMALMMDCSSGASPARLKRIEKEAADPANLLGDAVNGPYPGACAACGKPDLGAAFRAPLKCDVPVLFVSGDLDARTPPENVAEIQSGFAHHAHVIAQNAGHESIEMLSEEFRELLAGFLRGETVESRTIELPTPRFRKVESD